MEQVLDKYRKH